MRAAQVTRYYYPISGGQQVYVEELRKLLNKYNVDNIIVQPHVESQPDNDKIIFTSPLPFTYRIFKKIYNYSWFLFNAELYQYRNLLRLQDIIICHYSFHYPPLKWHEKVIVLSHGLLWNKQEPTLFDKYLKWQDSKAIKQGNVTVVVNDTHFLRELGLNIEAETGFFKKVTDNIWFIPNCVDTNTFKPDKTVSKEKIILVPRNIRYERGIHLAISAFSIFERENPDYKLLIVGGPTYGDYFNLCVDIAKGANIYEKVVFNDNVRWEDMPKYYNMASLTLIPTIEKEGTSLSALESMACATPVVSTNVGGLLDLPTSKAKPESKAIADKMIDVLKDLNKITQYQYQNVVEKFNMNNWQKAWIDVIMETYNKK